MAQRVVLQLDCDMDSKSGADVETRVFGYQGSSYELELCGKHRKALDEALSQLAASGRKVSTQRTRAVARKPATVRSKDNAEIRAWAATNGIKVSGRGRISADVIDKFRASSNARTVVIPKFADGSSSL